MGLGQWLSSLFDDDDRKPVGNTPVNQRGGTPPAGSPEAASRGAGNIATLQHRGERNASRWGDTTEVWTGLGQEKYRGSAIPPGTSTKGDPWLEKLLADAEANPPTQDWILRNTWLPGQVRPGTELPWQPAPGNGPAPELNRTNRALLEALGWKLPGEAPAAAGVTLDNLLDQSKGRDLAAYQYNIERPELELLQMATEGKKGVTQGEALAAGDRRVGTGKIRAVPLTPEAYKNLTPEQKRAVDFNTMFVEAREKDLALTDEEGKGSTYDKAIEEMFGKESGSTKYAPNTMDLLGKIGYQAKGQDLDEFLSGEQLVSLDELQNFTFTDTELKQEALAPRSQVGVNQYIDTRSTANQAVAQEQLVELAGAYIDEALKNPQVWDVPSAAVFSATGAPPTGMTVPWGFGTAADRLNVEGVYDNPLDETRDQDLRDAYAMMQNPENTVDRFWTTANDLGMTEGDLQTMFNYFDVQSRKDAATGIVTPGMRSPNEMRELFGLGGL